MTQIGKDPPRVDGEAKVSGRAVYTADIVMPGMMFGATLRSPHARARIKRLAWHSRQAPEGSVCITARDLETRKGVLVLDDTWPILAAEEVHHAGEAVALVAAPTPEAARRALATIDIEYQPLPAVLSWEEAEQAEPLSRLELVSGDVDQAFCEADRIIEHTYETGPQEHVSIECQAMMAWFDKAKRLNVVGSMQCPYFIQNALSHALETPAERISVKPAAVGGGFGGKEDYPSLLALHAALLSRACGRPVRIVYDRHEEIIATTKRHPSRVRHKTAVTSEGRLLGMEVEVDLDGGAYRTLSPVVLSRAVLHATGPYRCPNVRIRGRVLQTNRVPSGAFRGFGAPQVHFAAERQMDRIARILGIDPYTIRKRNVLEPGQRLATGQLLDASASGSVCLEEAVEKTNFQRRWRQLEGTRARRKDGESIRGIGLSLFYHGAGFTGLGEHRMRAPVVVRLTEEGQIEILTSTTEMGQGMATVFRQIAAEAVGVSLDDITLHEPDTAVVPDSGPTVASRATMVIGATIVRAVRALRDRVQTDATGDIPATSFREAARRHFERHGPSALTVRHEPPAWQEFDEESYHGSAYATYGWGADVVEVEVDPDTYEVRPTRATSVCDAGRVIHRTLCRGQIEGGTMQAIGWALHEEIKQENGRILNDRLATYIIPTMMDAPRMNVHLIEHPWEGGPFGAKGIGELPMDGGAPAVVQAIENATGIVVDAIPATPERLYAWSRDSRTVDQVPASDPKKGPTS